MHIGIITRKLPPEICGIGDHTTHLKTALQNLGHKVTIFAGRGLSQGDQLIVSDDWNEKSLMQLFVVIEDRQIDHLILQFTPLMYSDKNGQTDFAVVKFWQRCSKRWLTSIILHESYFRVWQRPTSWVRGTIQKRLLLSLVATSRYVFTASEPLAQEINAHEPQKKVTRLPLGSHFLVTQVNRDEFRAQHGIEPDEIVLTLFGGGNALRWLNHYVNKLDSYLSQRDNKVRWLLLGGVVPDWFTLTQPISTPGYLSNENLSAWLQTTDIFLVPHECGLNAKRSTVVAAMQHGLPIVGTRGYMTDSFWSEIGGVSLTPLSNAYVFCEKVHELCVYPHLRRVYGHSNREYYLDKFMWSKIANKFMSTIQ